MKPSPYTAIGVSALALAIAVAGCGGGGGSSPTNSVATGPFPTPTVPKGAPQPPKGASPVLYQIYRQFTPPKPDPAVKGSKAAIEAGKAACAHKTPSEVKATYFPIALQKGTLKANSPQAKMIASIDKYAKQAARDSSFVAGQLAADAYQATLPVKTGQFGYQGCVYALARGLERQLGAKR